MPVREVDDALARAFSARESATRPTDGVARPHFSVEPPNRADRTPPARWRWPDLIGMLEAEHHPRFEAMAHQIREACRLRGAKVLLLTSAHRAEGRTTLAIMLAKTLANSPGPVLLIDADLHAPTLAQRLCIDVAAGMDDVVLGTHSAAQAILALQGQLSVLPLRAPVPRAREFLRSPAWLCLMARLRREFDWILLDGGPLFTGLNAALFHKTVDAAVLVFKRGHGSERALLRAREVLDAGGVPVLGLAENFA